MKKEMQGSNSGDYNIHAPGEPNSQLPDFIVIGAGKSGTTSLDKYMKHHPGLFMSERKEPNYFALEDMSMEDKLRNPYYLTCITDLKDYLDLFRDAPFGKLKGEISPMYLYHPGTASRIFRRIPDVKLIAILRHPVDRLYSRYLHLARDGRLPTKNFSDALDRSTIWWRRGDLVREGMYGQHLGEYFQVFKKDQIRVYFFEQLQQSPETLLEDIYSFLGVDNDISVDDHLVYNKSGFKKSRLYDHLLGHNSFIKSIVKTIFPSFYKRLKRYPKLVGAVQSIQDRNLVRPGLDPALRKQMIREIYHEDILKLQELLSVDLSGWLR